jgi:hypothetical protein
MRGAGGPSRNRPGLFSAGHVAPLTTAAKHGQKCWAPFGPGAVDRLTDREAGLPEMVSPPGAMRSKPHKHRARDAWELADLRH